MKFKSSLIRDCFSFAQNCIILGLKDGMGNLHAQGIYENQYGWWKTTDGKVTFKENGLFSNEYGTWKVENSKVNFGFNGTYQGKTIKNGKVV